MTEHRPYPLPERPWVLRQSWTQLLFAHWPVPSDALRALVPDSLAIDTFDGLAWIALVPFAMRRVAPRLVPEMGPLSNFLELNIRTYVLKDGIPGVYFFSLDCNNPLAVFGARTAFYLPYYNATMKMATDKGGVDYESRRAGSSNAVFSASYRSLGDSFHSQPDSLEHFLTERYCLYTTDRGGNCYRADIHHLPWPLHRAEAEISVDTLSLHQLGFELPKTEPHLLYSERIDTVCWSLKRL